MTRVGDLLLDLSDRLGFMVGNVEVYVHPNNPLHFWPIRVIADDTLDKHTVLVIAQSQNGASVGKIQYTNAFFEGTYMNTSTPQCPTNFATGHTHVGGGGLTTAFDAAIESEIGGALAYPSSSSWQGKTCQHTWKRYNGIMQVFDFCETCDEKRGV